MANGLLGGISDFLGGRQGTSSIAQGLQSAGAALQGGEAQRRFDLQQADQQKRRDEFEEERKTTQFTDAQAALNFMKQGRPDAVLQLGLSRLESAAQFPQVDFSDTEQRVQLAELAQQPGPEGDEAKERLTKLLQNDVDIGFETGALERPKELTEREKADTAKIKAATAKLTAEAGAIDQPLVSSKERAETNKIIAETDKLNREAARGTGQEPIKLGDEQKETVKQNVKRTALLSATSSNRKLGLKKAQEFLAKFEAGEVESGTTRTVAGFLPGVFSKQGEFDETFDSFAEFAAREKLKASGETRPTDSDVKGAKEALFGVGRDEGTNITLLKEFITELRSQDAELADLKDAKKNKTLQDFTFQGTATSQQGILQTLPQGSSANDDGSFTLPDGRKIRPKAR